MEIISLNYLQEICDSIQKYKQAVKEVDKLRIEDMSEYQKEQAGKDFKPCFLYAIDPLDPKREDKVKFLLKLHMLFKVKALVMQDHYDEENFTLKIESTEIE
jgi:hypothetical protein